MSVIDIGGNVRNGEELDDRAVGNWLIEHGEDISGPVEVTQYSGGASNWTYRLKYENADLILRRPPTGTKAKSAHDMSREYYVQRALAEYYPVVPEMVLLCQDESVIGCDFYVMKRIEGIIPRANLPKEINFDELQTRELCTNFIDKLIELHQVPYEGTDLEKLGKGDGYCQRQVDGWDSRYEKAKTINVPSFKYVRQWLKDHVPSDSKTCVIHNDWRFDNVILDPENPSKIIGVLDWEMATLGDPLMDLGSSLAYWVEESDNAIFKATRRQPTHLKGMFTRAEVVEYYLNKTGLKTDNWTFYEVFGIFRLAVIAQQIYYRYYHKQTNNPAFKDFWIVIHALHIRALKLIGLQKIEANDIAQKYIAKFKELMPK
ncbi:phosphotransferase family protein [Acinetobacter faecalis]|uniref:phosphotransferase family protein n=1 Tax=Acinetobacter faecalis TaxID=2665161 RepID=UPI002A912714|nr:phosphotransferase family protein [Acinetobacter faecalis]MDY6460610.1 phosphotransferase family protein [Acinetobacter faecalis]MDY6483883.1 phosphotransferase family protein [Acinetobacter faecalis]MDY6523655.1 phosphotransferase family protein [Acinetobacter faecalis]MDY6535380.1 phosphotransferase family protein [Acinetobacter faecalis]